MILIKNKVTHTHTYIYTHTYQINRRIAKKMFISRGGLMHLES